MPYAPSPSHRCRALVLCVLLLLPLAPLEAGRPDLPVGYEFATWLGTGLYEIGGRDVWLINLPLHREIREASDEHLGLGLLLPVSVGWLDTRRLDSNDLQTLTFIPGLELTYRPTSWWRLRPFAQTGIGKDLTSGDTAWVYAGGIKSRMQTTRGDFTYALGNALVAAGSQSDGDRSSFVRFDAGVSVERPLSWQLAGRGTKLSAFYVASLFSDNADLAASLNRDRFNLGTVHNLGLSLGVQQPFDIFGFKLEWLGISWMTGDNIKGIRLNTGFPL